MARSDQPADSTISAISKQMLFGSAAQPGKQIGCCQTPLPFGAMQCAVLALPQYPPMTEQRLA